MTRLYRYLQIFIILSWSVTRFRQETGSREESSIYLLSEPTISELWSRAETSNLYQT